MVITILKSNVTVQLINESSPPVLDVEETTYIEKKLQQELAGLSQGSIRGQRQQQTVLQSHLSVSCRLHPALVSVQQLQPQQF